MCSFSQYKLHALSFILTWCHLCNRLSTELSIYMFCGSFHDRRTVEHQHPIIAIQFFLKSHLVSYLLSSLRHRFVYFRYICAYTLVWDSPWLPSTQWYNFIAQSLLISLPVTLLHPLFLFSIMAVPGWVTHSTVEKELIPNLENCALKASARRCVSFINIVYIHWLIRRGRSDKCHVLRTCSPEFVEEPDSPPRVIRWWVLSLSLFLLCFLIILVRLICIPNDPSPVTPLLKCVKADRFVPPTFFCTI